MWGEKCALHVLISCSTGDITLVLSYTTVGEGEGREGRMVQDLRGAREKMRGVREMTREGRR